MLLSDIVRKHAYLNKDKIALVDETNHLTFNAVNLRVNQVIHALQDKGIKNGDRIAVLLYNTNDYAVLYFALTKAGFIIVPINYRLLAREFLYILKNCEPRAFIFDRDILEAVKNMRNDIGFIAKFIVVGDDTQENGIDHFEEMISEYPNDEPAVDISEDDLALIMYTSGTTGRSKGAMITQKNMMAAIINQFTEICPDRNDVLINFPPLYHMGGLLTFLSHFYRGCTPSCACYAKYDHEPPRPKKI